MLVRDTESLQVGESTTIERLITDADVAIFAMITGLGHPLYLDAPYAATTRFGRQLVPHALLAALLEVMLAGVFTGLRGLPQNHTAEYLAPAYVDETVTLVCHILARNDEGTVFTCGINATRQDGVEVIRGVVDLALEDLPDAPIIEE